ncbi:hypothetical protein Aca07nite_23170 [Actinoplanes capillaceus]|uniref:Uncharacterized protein n=1 Tax=Actinoplanes campanulatus TaxID=113559 RepID=A0ABQ3WDE4_9ACTN|nr:hypothetical protein Aca07nite_23170 [Actinoplanes capillaceus]
MIGRIREPLSWLSAPFPRSLNREKGGGADLGELTTFGGGQLTKIAKNHNRNHPHGASDSTCGSVQPI